MVIRLLGLLAGLSAATDLGSGSGDDESLLRCLVATRFARSLGCSDEEVATVLHVSLLEHLGCTAYSHEAAAIWGDDIVSTRLAFLTDWTERKDLVRTFVPGLAEATGRSKASVIATALRSGRRVAAEGPPATCEVARDAARRLGLPEPVRDGLHATLAMWNGDGQPPLRGELIPLPTRIMHVASTAVMYLLHADADVALAQVGRRAGTYLDPALARSFGPAMLEGLLGVDPYQAVLDTEPDPARLVDDDELVAVARTFGDLVDLKSPWLQGHSAAVGDLAADAAATLLGMDDSRHVRLAGYLHDLGRIAVSSRIWDKPGPLSGTERQQVELHPYYSERVLARVPVLAHVGRLAGQHHERSDGTGYHRGLTAAAMPMPARVLAAADRYRSLLEDRPYRPAVARTDAAGRLRKEARAGHLDGDAVEAVLEAAGHRRGVRRPRPAGLTERQVEVLRLVAAGLSNRDIARRLVISPRTAEHHVQDVYLKIGVSTRAGAALYGMEHGLLDKPG